MNIREKGKVRPEYLLDKNAFILLVMNYTGYNHFKRAYIKRFDEMNKQLKLAIQKSYLEVLRLYEDEVERQETAEKQRDKVILEKRLIGSRQDATASAKTREANK